MRTNFAQVEFKNSTLSTEKLRFRRLHEIRLLELSSLVLTRGYLGCVSHVESLKRKVHLRGMQRDAVTQDDKNGSRG